MKLPQLLSRKKLRATTARRALGGAEMDFEEMSEPNMKLSRALLIVLLLHVVAVAGIIAFNAIKSRQGGLPVVSSSHVTKTASNPEDVKETPSSPAKSSKKAKENDSIPDGGKVYIVRKRDNPVTIAKKFKVSYDDLLAANHIDDPHKLKVGQKLIIPAKSSKTKKATE